MLGSGVERKTPETGMCISWFVNLLKVDPSVFSQQVLMTTFKKYALPFLISKEGCDTGSKALTQLLLDIPRSFGALSSEASECLFGRGRVFQYLSEKYRALKEEDKKTYLADQQDNPLAGLFDSAKGGCNLCGQDTSFGKMVRSFVMVFAVVNGDLSKEESWYADISAYMTNKELNGINGSGSSGHVIVKNQQGRNVLYGVGDWKFYIKIGNDYYLFSFLGKHCFDSDPAIYEKNSDVVLDVKKVTKDDAEQATPLSEVPIGQAYVTLLDLTDRVASLGQFLASLFLNPYCYRDCFNRGKADCYSEAFAYFMVQSVNEKYPDCLNARQLDEFQKRFEQAKTEEKLKTVYTDMVAAAEKAKNQKESIETDFGVRLFPGNVSNFSIGKKVNDDALRYLLSSSYTEDQNFRDAVGEVKERVVGEKTVYKGVCYYEYSAKLVALDYYESGISIKRSDPFVIRCAVKDDTIDVSVVPIAMAFADPEKLKSNGTVVIDSNVVKHTTDVEDDSSIKCTVYQGFFRELPNKQRMQNNTKNLFSWIFDMICAKLREVVGHICKRDKAFSGIGLLVGQKNMDVGEQGDDSCRDVCVAAG